MNPTPPQAAGSLNRFLNAIEAAGNKLPHITMLFIWALVITLVISLALSYVSFDYRHPSTGAVIAVTNMLAPANLLELVVNSVKNFMGFPPLGITLVATLGIGIAEGSGFIHTLLRKLMSYIPRAALTADEIAKEADFFSFGTNDLTQMTFGFSRDDAGKFLGAYYDKKIYESDPFARLDQTGVGKLVSMAAKMGRETNPHIHLGICGEHGGDPTSVEFCHKVGLDYVSCSPFRVPIARLAAAQAAIREQRQ